MIKRILYASDFSRTSRRALTLAQALARAFRAELILFHAYPQRARVTGEGYLPSKLLEEMRAAEREAARRKLERLAKSLGRRGVRVSALLADGPAAAAIVRAAQRRRAGLVVLGTHGRSGIGRVLLGSVAERVVRTARCPVVTVRAER